MSFEDLKLIYSYSRKQAIEDSVLIDVTDQAREMRPWQAQYPFAQPGWSCDRLKKQTTAYLLKQLQIVRDNFHDS